MRLLSALTGRTTERVTHTATPTASTIAISAIRMMMRVPEAAVARASPTLSAASWLAASSSASPELLEHRVGS